MVQLKRKKKRLQTKIRNSLQEHFSTSFVSIIPYTTNIENKSLFFDPSVFHFL